MVLVCGSHILVLIQDKKHNPVKENSVKLNMKNKLNFKFARHIIIAYFFLIIGIELTALKDHSKQFSFSYSTT